MQREILRKNGVIIKRALLDQAGEEIKKVWSGQNYVIISDENVWPLYGERLEKSLEAVGFTGMKIVIEAGEDSKSLERFKFICEALAAFDVGRDWLVIALGGGVVGDLAGFVAATYKRGMEVVQIPTSLIAQADSSLGGKTGLNLEEGKNLIGAFHRPLLVLTDIDVLQTLADKLLAEGMAEIIKYGAILDKDFFEKLENMSVQEGLKGLETPADLSCLKDLVRVAAAGKLRITEKDERDKGERRKLNFGHSFGHAIEKMGGYRNYSHGESVAIGMFLAAQIGEILTLTKKGTAERIKGVLEKFGLSTILPEEMRGKSKGILKIMMGDKKNEAEKLNVVLLEEIGKSFIYAIEAESLLQSLEECMKIDVLEIDKMPHGVVKLPPSKSYGHRIIIGSALAGDMDLLKNLGLYAEKTQSSYGIDVLATLACMELLLGWKEGERLNAEESGSTLRFILPLALALGKDVAIDAAESLLNRPQKIYYDILGKAGGSIERKGNTLFISGKLEPGIFIVPGNISSQYISGLLLALPLLEGDSVIKLEGSLESAPYVDMTINAMKLFGVEVVVKTVRNLGEDMEKDAGEIEYHIKGGQKYISNRSQETIEEMEGDYSAAAYFLVAGALGCKVECAELKIDSLQGDRAILQFLKEVGAIVEVKDNGNIAIRPGELKGIEADISQCPDLAPPLAVLLSFCKGNSKIIGAERLALKESNRLESITEALNALGGSVKLEKSGLLIKGQESIKGGRANPSNDHRIAMAIALASVKSTGKVFLEDPACVNKSYPNFFKDFCRIEREIEERENE